MVLDYLVKEKLVHFNNNRAKKGLGVLYYAVFS